MKKNSILLVEGVWIVSFKLPEALKQEKNDEEMNIENNA